MTEKRTKKLKCIIDYYGKENQIVKTLEEMGELQQVLAKSITQPDKVAKTEVSTEIADVEIMLNQMKIIFDCEKDVEFWKPMKISRQFERMGNE